MNPTQISFQKGKVVDTCTNKISVVFEKSWTDSIFDINQMHDLDERPDYTKLLALSLSNIKVMRDRLY